MPYSARKQDRARTLRKSQTDAELLLWKQLRNRCTAKYKFRRQHSFGPYFLDFVCLEKWLVIEVDGSQHMQHPAYDNKRTAWLESRGFRVLRFWDNDVLMKTDSVMQVIFEALTGPSP